MRGGQVDAAVQMLGVDLLQFAGQGLQLLPGHMSHGVQAGGGGRQVLNRLQDLVDGAVVPEQIGQQGQPLADEQHRPGPTQGAGYAGEIHRDRVGLSGAFQLHRVVLHQVVLVQGVRGLPADPQPVEGDWDALGLPVQGRDAVIAGLHPGDGVRSGHSSDVHQSHHVGAAVFRPQEQAGGGHDDQQQIHHKEDTQLAKEKTEIQAEH